MIPSVGVGGRKAHSILERRVGSQSHTEMRIDDKISTSEDILLRTERAQCELRALALAGLFANVSHILRLIRDDSFDRLPSCEFL